jgi:hypothetical protein
MSKFGGKSDSTNRELVDMQKAEAANAEAKEKARQARLKYGRDMIEATFNGGTVAGVPTTATRDVWKPSSPIFNMAAGVFGGNKGTTAKKPTGSWVKEAYEVPGQSQTMGGIGQDFYENYRQSLEGFYKPDIENQFTEARSQNLFDLARKGLLRSSVSADRAGDLVRDKSAADARVASEIEGQVTGLKGDVNAAKQKAYGLLTSTEDPTTAANTALTEVNAIQTRKPQFSALGDLFASALNSYSTFRNAQAARQAVASVPARSPNQSSGVNYA